MFCWGFIVFGNFQGLFIKDYNTILDISIAGAFIVSPAIIFGLLTIYKSLYEKYPKQFFVFLFLAVVQTIWLFIDITDETAGYVIYAFIALAGLEIFRILIFAGFKKWKKRALTLIGFSIFMLALIYQLLTNIELVPRFGEYGIIYVHGLLVLSILVSMDLSLQFAKMN